ncbi:NAD(P)-binding protein [Setomelanomma holmii]|uniref:NAD(P)-binding protein n=1 Tax=Setomelanomma holmii TaxID=210430 RepID=A0A9P4LSR5_9PLEO|nr:NAD(P)-binding protein [Setomelanomma holmii]
MASEYTVLRGVEGAIKPSSVPKPQLRPRDILIKISHFGGVGIVEAIGSDVTQFKVCECAGGGYHRDSCGHCSYCLSGQDIWCYERKAYLHKVPEGLASEHAAPLQCAGASTDNALIQVVKPGDRIGIIGTGGLSHLAIQFAQKLGTEVVVFSTSRSKEEEAGKLGASEFYLLDELKKLEKPVNTLVVAGSKYPVWEKFMQKKVLARAGNVIPLAAPHGALNLRSFQMFFARYNIRSSLVAYRGRHDEMLQFAVTHIVKPWVETFELSEAGIADVVEKLNANKIRCRGVLVAKDA